MEDCCQDFFLIPPLIKGGKGKADMTLRMDDASVASLKVPWRGEILRRRLRMKIWEIPANNCRNDGEERMDGHVAPDVLLLGTAPLLSDQNSRLGEGIAETSGIRPRPE